MAAAPLPAQEVERLRALTDYDILGTPPEAAFDELVSLAARICGTPISAVSLIDGERVWVKASYGVTALELPRVVSFCTHALGQPNEILVVPDATLDPRFALNPFVTAKAGVRFYAGVPLTTPAGHVIGTLCVIGREPRTLTPDQLESLRVLGRQVMAQFELRRNLQAATVNHARLENSQRIAGLGDWEHDYLRQQLVWSDGIYRILGLERKANQPDSALFYQQVHPDDLAFVHRKKKAAAQGLCRVDFEHRLLRPDGEVRHIHQIAELILDEQGKAVREAGVIQDVTERKLATEALRQSEERYRLMFEHNPSPMWIFDRATFAFLAVNDAAVACYGYTREEFLGMTVMQIRPPELVPDFLERVASTAPPFRAAGRYRHWKKDGTIFPVDIFGHQQDFAGRPAQLVLAVDMTESEQTTAALRTSEARFRSLSESAPLGIFELDAAGGCIYHNPALTILSGRSLEQNLGQGWREVTHPDDREAVRASWVRATAAGLTWRNEHRLLRPDGSVRWVQTLAAPNKDSAGRLTGFVGTVEDITERRLIEVAMLESEERYRKLLMLSPDANLVHVDGIITLVNPAFCQLVGATDPAQLLGRRAVELVHPDDYALAHQMKQQLLAGQVVPRTEIRFLRLDGTAVEVEGVGMVFDFQGRKEIQVIGRDISARKRAEVELREKTALLEAQLDSSIDGILVVDGQGRKILENQRCIDLWSTPPELAGQNDEKQVEFATTRAMHPRQFLEKILHLYAHPEETSRDEIELVDGTVLDRYSAPVLGKDGRNYGRIWTFRDITARKQDEEARQRQQSELRALFDLIPAMIWFKDTKNGVLRVNQRVAEAVGRRIEDIEGKPSLEIYPKEAAKYYADDLEVIHSGTSKLGIVELLRPKDGKEIWVQTDKVPYRDKDGTVIGIVVMARDITAQKQAEESIHLLSSAVEQAKESILITDAQLNLPGPRIIFANPAFTQMTGYTAEEAIGLTPRILQGPRSDRRVLDRLRQNLERGEIFEGECINYRKDGKAYDQQWQIAPIRDTGGVTTHFVAIQRDVSERKAVELALRNSEERFKLVARAVSDVVWDWDIPADLMWRNEGFQATFGYSASDIEPGIESSTSRIHPDDQRRVVESLHHAIDTGAESWSAEYRFRRKDGTYAFVQDSGFIHRNATGVAVRMVGGMRDLTEQKEMEAQYLRAQRMESIGTLASGIAHDLNNVLAPIMMSIELLRLDTGDPARRNRILDTIQSSGRRGADLVRQVLSFSRGLDGERVTIRLRHLVNELQGIMRETFPRNIEVNTYVSDYVWPITGDPTQLHQVLLNLAVNARDAMPHGGKLTITASNLTLDDHFAGMSADARAGTYVLLQVADTGEGMTPEVRERIFEPFFTTKEIGKGTGLGLATVHTIVKSHGGFLSVESAVRRGTTFKIYLPADPALRTIATEPPFPTELPRGRNELVLVVDDESSIRDITQRTLETFGYRVVTARDGAEAVAVYSQRMAEIALVITDMMMPVMDGTASIRVLMRLNPAVKIIAASGLNSKEHVAKGDSHGVKDFLAKPYTAQTLLQLVRAVLDEQPAPLDPAIGLPV